jgi:hypothetical protein
MKMMAIPLFTTDRTSPVPTTQLYADWMSTMRTVNGYEPMFLISHYKRPSN